MSLTTATHGDAMRVVSSVFIIAQIDTRNREYLIRQLQKKILKQILFDQGTLSDSLVFKEIYFL